MLGGGGGCCGPPETTRSMILTASGYTCLYLVTRQEGFTASMASFWRNKGSSISLLGSVLVGGGASKLCLPCLRLLSGEWW